MAKVVAPVRLSPPPPPIWPSVEYNHVGLIWGTIQLSSHGIVYALILKLQQRNGMARLASLLKAAMVSYRELSYPQFFYN